MDFEKLTSYRRCGHEGVDALLWVTSDSGAFGNERDGPLFDWIADHHLFMDHVKQFKTVIQAGGNCGMYARFYKNYFEKVYTFEPDELNFYCLDRNCVGDGYVKVKGGLGNTTQKFTIENNNTKNVGTHKIKDTPGDVQMYRIDDMTLEHCDLIHLDIEGYEEKALEGAVETIRKFTPVVVTEANRGASFLEKLNYKRASRGRMDSIFVYGWHD